MKGLKRYEIVYNIFCRNVGFLDKKKLFYTKRGYFRFLLARFEIVLTTLLSAENMANCILNAAYTIQIPYFAIKMIFFSRKWPKSLEGSCFYAHVCHFGCFFKLPKF